MERNRLNGVLLHISQLPSPFGIGSLGQEAYDFIDFLDKSDVRIWQVLPLNVTSYGDSPYQSPSASGLNYFFIDLRILVQKGLLNPVEFSSLNFGTNEQRVDYARLFDVRINILKRAFERFDKNDKKFLKFVSKGEFNDFSFFMTLKELNGYKPWYDWQTQYHYTPELEKQVKEQNCDLYLFYYWTQYEFLDEFNKLKCYAHSKDIKLMGDLPIYVSYDSVEAYKYPEIFKFDNKHNPTVVAGCPPDYFSPLGQLWGNPIYDWDYMADDSYSWYKDRIRANLNLFDIIRIDHFRGFSSYYTIPYGNTDAVEGKWVKGPGIELFNDLKALPIIAEDLGDIDDEVKQLLADSGFPGMKVLEFAFDGNKNNDHKPSNFKSNCVVYTGTHDNMPLLGFLDDLGEGALKTFKEDLKKECELLDVDYKDDTKEDIVKTTISLAYASKAYLAIIPMADLCVLGKEARINFPSTTSLDNWSYRFLKKDFSEEVSNFIKTNVTKYKR